MTDAECVALLQWALPRLGLRWTGFRWLKGQVCKRIRRRIVQLGLPDAAAYRARLESDAAEWQLLDGFCVVTISRFYRDHATWEVLRDEVLPRLAQQASAEGEMELRCWALGCASGEEPYTLSIVWELAVAPRFPDLRLRILATDIDDQVLERARLGRYEAGTLRELPPEWRDQAFELRDGTYDLRERFRAPVELRREDVRTTLPDETFRLVLCRNVVLTYVHDERQPEVLAGILSRLSSGGAFVIGRGEVLPKETALDLWLPERGVFRAPGASGSSKPSMRS